MSKKKTALIFLPRLVGGALFSAVQYAFLLVTLAGCFLLFSVLNRTQVVGKSRARLRPGIFLVSNHQSLIDSFLIGYTVCVPTILSRPTLLPWHMPDRRNFFTNPFLRPLMRLWRAIPVERENGNGSAAGAGNLSSNRQVKDVLRRGVVHVFIEGTRSPTQSFQPPKVRVAKSILLANASVLLVYLNGMHDVQPYVKSADDAKPSLLHVFGKHVAWIFHVRSGNRVDVVVGDTIEPQELMRMAGDGDLNERSARLAAALMDRLAALRSLAPSLRRTAV